jgi:serine protease Do
MSSKRWQRRVLRAGMAPLLMGVGALAVVGLRGNAKQETPRPPVVPTQQVLSIQDNFEQVANALRPSVVSIKSRETTNGAVFQQGRQQGDAPFGFQFPGFPGGQFRQMPQGPQHATASGSGVIVRSDGYILTNDHVVAGADRVTVQLLDGREFVGKVLRDPGSDLAVVKINADNLPTAQIANSDDVKIGQWALAFGSPFRLNDTMTVGVISSLKRSETIGDATDQRYYPSLLQTDASINPGNSGGPLVDVYGRVVGIDVAIESPNGGNVGIGFAIPSNTARYVMDQLISKGKVVRGFLGLRPATLTYDQQQHYGVKQGALVVNVQAGTPAAAAGLKVEDIVTQVDGKPVTSEADFRDMVARLAPGSSVPLTVWRDGASRTVDVKVGERPLANEAQDQAPARQKARGKLGVSIADANDPNARQQLQQMGVKPGQDTGAVVVDVTQGSAAFEAGIMPGDVIVKFNGKPVANAQDLSNAVADLPSGTQVPVIVQRQVQGKPDTALVTVEVD